MKKQIAFLFVLVLLTVLPLTVSADGPKASETGSPAATEGPADNLVVRQHSAVIQGKKLDYTTVTGTMVVDTAGGQCEIFFTAYTLDATEDLSSRPLTFAFNGGPGSSSEWMHMGFLGPRRVSTDQNGKIQQYPVPIVDNEYSILDLTDLVFIDPVGTGYSHPADGVDSAEFLGYENDIRSVGDFIRLYVNRNNRWSSPKYLAGESYGTMRAIGLCKYLSDTYSMGLNGLLMVSSINDFSVIMEGEAPSDLAYALYLPTYAADAWYHERLEESYQTMQLEDLLEEVRAFAGGDYMSALFRGRSLGAEEKNEIAARLAAYTGLKAEDYVKANLRLNYRDFCVSLLEDQNLVIGRLDGRYTGPLTSGDIADGSSDPSDAALDNAFGTAVSQYITEELDYHTDLAYVPISLEVNYSWDLPVDELSGFRQEQTIHEQISKNRFLKVWVLGGYYDLATPVGMVEWVYNHVFLNDGYDNNLQFSFYPSGHMIYLHEPSLAAFREQAEAWYTTAVTVP
ncbi:MAG: hypothetical protein K6C12_11255 [Oscillospiraceae bacterium]|nr:hypothetical protein [Oscillospiraceae bacterium]